MAGIEGEYWAYCFDEAIGILGNGIENRLHKIDGKQAEFKRQRELMIILGASEEEKKKLFRSPGGSVRK